MRKKTGLTIVERAIIAVPGFESIAKKLEQQVTLRGQSQSTLNNYIRRIAIISLHFDKLPEQIEEDEINEYLAALARDPKSPSRSSFKHMVYGLRYYGIYNHTTKRSLELMFVPEKLNIEKLIKFKETSTEHIKRLTGFDIGLCQNCKKGKMHVINVIPRNRDPPSHLPSVFVSKLQ